MFWSQFDVQDAKRTKQIIFEVEQLLVWGDETSQSEASDFAWKRSKPAHFKILNEYNKKCFSDQSTSWEQNIQNVENLRFVQNFWLQGKSAWTFFSNSTANCFQTPFTRTIDQISNLKRNFLLVVAWDVCIWLQPKLSKTFHFSCLTYHILVHIGRQWGPIVPGHHHSPPRTPVGRWQWDMGVRGVSCLRCLLLVYIGRQYGPIVPGQHHWPPITPKEAWWWDTGYGTRDKGWCLLWVGIRRTNFWHNHHGREEFCLCWTLMLVSWKYQVLLLLWNTPKPSDGNASTRQSRQKVCGYQLHKIRIKLSCGQCSRKEFVKSEFLCSLCIKVQLGVAENFGTVAQIVLNVRKYKYLVNKVYWENVVWGVWVVIFDSQKCSHGFYQIWWKCSKWARFGSKNV